MDNIKQITTEELVDLRLKAKKWDLLESKIAACYGYEDKNGEWQEHKEDEGGDLIVIGELAAVAFGFM